VSRRTARAPASRTGRPKPSTKKMYHPPTAGCCSHVPARRPRPARLRLVQHPAGDDGGLYDERDHVDDLVDHALVPVERGRALPQPGQAVQQGLVASRAQVVHCTCIPTPLHQYVRTRAAVISPRPCVRVAELKTH
jgi:hypothetical protein